MRAPEALPQQAAHRPGRQVRAHVEGNPYAVMWVFVNLLAWSWFGAALLVATLLVGLASSLSLAGVAVGLISFIVLIGLISFGSTLFYIIRWSPDGWRGGFEISFDLDGIHATSTAFHPSQPLVWPWAQVISVHSAKASHLISFQDGTKLALPPGTIDQASMDAILARR